MAAKFRVAARVDPRDAAAPLRYYPVLRSTGRVTLRELAEQVAQISTLSTADTFAVLEALLTVLPDVLAEGRIVEVGELGTFTLSIRTEPSATPEAVTGRQIISVAPAFRPSRLFKRLLGQRARFERADDPR